MGEFNEVHAMMRPNWSQAQLPDRPVTRSAPANSSPTPTSSKFSIRGARAVEAVGCPIVHRPAPLAKHRIIAASGDTRTTAFPHEKSIDAKTRNVIRYAPYSNQRSLSALSSTDLHSATHKKQLHDLRTLQPMTLEVKHA